MDEELHSIQNILLKNKIDISINDIRTLKYLYKTDVEILNKASQFTIENKIKNWYGGSTKLSNMDEFRTAALHFKEFGVYTKERRNTHPNSLYVKFWKEEAQRCIKGYHIGRDYISGYNYFYLNYSPMDRIIKGDDGNRKGTKVKTFPDVWDSDYYYYHFIEECERRGRDAVDLKARRKGYSYKHGSMATRNLVLIPFSKSYIFAADKQYLTSADGILNKAWQILYFIQENTEFRKGLLIDKVEHKRTGDKVYRNGLLVETGYLSDVIGISLKDDPDKARGISAKLMLFEEAGSFEKLIDAWNITEESIKQDDVVYGTRIAYGTGGQEGKGFDGLKDLYYKPISHHILGIPNVWTKNAEQQIVGWFHPAYVSVQGKYDKDGNSDMQGAISDIMVEREKWRADNLSSNEVLKKKAERPITPEEAVLRTEGSPFPVTQLKDRLIELEGAEYKGIQSIGHFVMHETGRVAWVNDMSDSYTPVETLKYDESNRRGAVVIHHHPILRDIDNAIPEGRYIIGVDPIEFSREEVGDKYSLCSAVVIDCFTEQLVGEYHGRPDTEDEAYETIRRLAMYYKAKVNYENQLKGIFRHFEKKNSMDLLSLAPKNLMNKLDIKSEGNRQYGTTASPRINSYARGRIKDWLVRDCPDISKNDPDVLMITNLQRIRSKRILNELIEWHPDGNFDGVSALGMAMLLLDDMDVSNDYNIEKVSDLLNDSFWYTALGLRKR